jgi:hypothetical protein
MTSAHLLSTYRKSIASPTPAPRPAGGAGRL